MLHYLRREPGFYKRLFLLALPLILCRTHSGIRIPKWFFYAFYPAHLAVIALVGWCMGV